MKNKPIRIILWLVLALVVAGLILALLAKPAVPHTYFDSDQVLVMAHRGGRHLWPENTLYAFERAHDLGVDVLEMDLHSTRDGAIVVLHDKTVDRTTDGTSAVQDYTLAELKELDAGYQWTQDEGLTYPHRGQGIMVPTLEEVMAAFPCARLNIEIKQSEPSIVAPVCSLIREHGMAGRILVASFDSATIQAFRQACPEVASTAGEDEVRTLYILSFVYLGGLYQPAYEALQLPEYRGDLHVLTPRLVSAAHNRGLEVHAWTINQVEDMQRMLDMGVDGIITDRPDLLLDLLGR
jgi:glycerophosphoryl diester phosphodiesterase